MITEVRVPDIGENIESGDVVKVLVAVGDQVEVDQPLIELETDKAVVEVPSTAKGRVAEILVSAGETIPIGQVIVKVETSGAKAAEGTPAPAEVAKPARKTAPRAEVNPEPPAAAESVAAEAESAAAQTAGSSVAASPAVRRLARELGVDLAGVTGSSAGGRISSDDVKDYVKAVLSGRSPQVSTPAELPDFDRFGKVERKPLSKVRRIMAKNMTTSWTTIPHVTQHDRADVTSLEKFRKGASAKVEAHGAKLTVTAILLRLCATALKTFPQFNASYDAETEELIYKQYYNIGVAVDTERGLIVPVVKNADTKSLTQLAVELDDLARRTRDKKVKPDELEGGNFTISNLGGIGGTAFTPIVYAPQVAILGVARTQREATLASGKWEERLYLPLSLSYDHRVIDGADGARFIRWLAEALEDPYLAVLES